MYRFRPGPLVFFATLLLLVVAQTPRTMSAQGFSTESKTMELSAFGGYESVNPDHYASPRNNGFVAGTDLTRYFHWPVAPSLEFRANIADGSSVDEKSYLGGLRAEADLLHRFRPYADFLIGAGSIQYNHPAIAGYTHDNSIVDSYGGGVDIDLIDHFAVKVDFQGQHWNFGHNYTIAPTALTLGIVYHIPFRPHVSQRDLQP